MTYAEARRHVLGLLPEGAVGAEIGVWTGDFSAAILAAARPRVLHLIDPWQANPAPDHAQAWYSTARGLDIDAVHAGVCARFADEVTAGQVEIHRAPSAEALARLPDAGLDFVYVDGDHAYPAVREDLELSVAKVRPGGVICVDDHYDGKWWGDGVIRAVNEVLGAHAAALEIRFALAGQVVLLRR